MHVQRGWLHTSPGGPPLVVRGGGAGWCLVVVVVWRQLVVVAVEQDRAALPSLRAVNEQVKGGVGRGR